jgi:hypothetical protein
MRTPQEIVDRIKKVQPDDMFGFQLGDLLPYLPWEQAKEFLNEEGKKEFEGGKWKYEEPTKENITKVVREYMEFALGKAENHRGLSAGRSIEHFKAWIWLLGDEDYGAINWDEYENYGAPILRQVCERYGIPFPMDNKGLERMSRGLSCREGCDEGCGK